MKFQGIWTALVTPFNSTGDIDWPAFDRLLAAQVAGKVAGVVPCGTTGESPTLTEAERKSVILRTVSVLRGTGVGVMAGTGSNNTAETAAFSRWAGEQSVDGVLVVTPYYNKPSQAGLKAHFKTVADMASCPVILYNVPGRAGVSLSAGTIAELADHSNIAGIKEATGDLSFGGDVFRALAGKDFSVLSGDDATFYALTTMGAVGNISVASNIIPKEMVALDTAARSGDVSTAQTLQKKYFGLFRDLFVEANPAPIKHALAWIGAIEPQLRLPLVGLTPDNAKKLEQTLQALALDRGAHSRKATL